MHKKPTTRTQSLEKEKYLVLTLYILFFGTIALSLITPANIAVASLLLCVLVLGFIYTICSKVDNESYIKSHSSHLIVTFWKANLYILYSTFAGVLYILAMTDYSALNPCFDFFTGRMLQIIELWSTDNYTSFFVSCSKPFLKDNQINISIGFFIMVFPILLYLLNRLILGWKHAWNNTIIPKSGHQ